MFSRQVSLDTLDSMSMVMDIAGGDLFLGYEEVLPRISYLSAFRTLSELVVDISKSCGRRWMSATAALCIYLSRGLRP